MEGSVASACAHKQADPHLGRKQSSVSLDIPLKQAPGAASLVMMMSLCLSTPKLHHACRQLPGPAVGRDHGTLGGLLGQTQPGSRILGLYPTAELTEREIARKEKQRPLDSHRASNTDRHIQKTLPLQQSRVKFMARKISQRR